MPKAYVAMRDKFKEEGMSEKAAEGKAARIFNANRPKGATPMGPNYEERAKAGKATGHNLKRVGIRKSAKGQ